MQEPNSGHLEVQEASSFYNQDLILEVTMTIILIKVTLTSLYTSIKHSVSDFLT